MVKAETSSLNKTEDFFIIVKKGVVAVLTSEAIAQAEIRYK